MNRNFPDNYLREFKVKGVMEGSEAKSVEKHRVEVRICTLLPTTYRVAKHLWHSHLRNTNERRLNEARANSDKLGELARFAAQEARKRYSNTRAHRSTVLVHQHHVVRVERRLHER